MIGLGYDFEFEKEPEFEFCVKVSEDKLSPKRDSVIYILRQNTIGFD